MEGSSTQTPPLTAQAQSQARPATTPTSNAASVTPRAVPIGSDPSSVSDAVNRLLEAAQSGVYPTVAKGQSSRTSDARMPDVRHVENLTAAPQDMAPPPAAPQDISNAANRAAAELASLKAARAETPDYYAGFKQVEKVDKVTLAERRKQDRARLRTANAGGSWVKILLSVVALALTCGAVWYVLQMKPAHKPVQATSIEEMVKAGDYDGAKTAMEKKKASTKRV